MPLFDFKCNACGDVREVFINPSISDPKCCGKKMTKQASAPSFVVKGYSAKNGYSGGQTKTLKASTLGKGNKNTRVTVTS